MGATTRAPTTSQSFMLCVMPALDEGSRSLVGTVALVQELLHDDLENRGRRHRRHRPYDAEGGAADEERDDDDTGLTPT